MQRNPHVRRTNAGSLKTVACHADHSEWLSIQLQSLADEGGVAVEAARSVTIAEDRRARLAVDGCAPRGRLRAKDGEVVRRGFHHKYSFERTAGCGEAHSIRESRVRVYA